MTDYNVFSPERCIRWDLVEPLDEADLSALQTAFHTDALKAVSIAISQGDHPDSPWQHYISPAFQPALSAASNWCRNPGGLRDRAFCYVDPLNWDYCEVPSCKQLPPLESTPQNEALPSTTSSASTVFAVSLLLVVCLAGGLICLVVWRRRSGRQCFSRRGFWVRRIPNDPCLLSDNVTFRASESDD